GLGGDPQVWSASILLRHLELAVRTRGGLVLESLSLSVCCGFIAGAVALIVCWLAVESNWFRNSALLLVAFVWAMSGPVLGLGLKGTITLMLDVLPFSFLEDALYRGPSPLPGVWVNLIRFLPPAVAILWPLVRLLPSELRDGARVEGAAPWQELRYI